MTYGDDDHFLRECNRFMGDTKANPHGLVVADQAKMYEMCVEQRKQLAAIRESKPEPKQMACWKCESVCAIPICRECARKDFMPEPCEIERLKASATRESATLRQRINGKDDRIAALERVTETLPTLMRLFSKIAMGDAMEEAYNKTADALDRETT